MEPVIELANLQLRMGQETPHPVEFRLAELRVEEGDQVAITGPSGCGKSTLLNLIAGLQRPDAGRIQVLGHSFSSLSNTHLDRLRGQWIGMVHQEFLLLDRFSALENVLVGLRFARTKPSLRTAQARLALERVGLTHRLHARPPRLSMGERQRVALARAMAHRPRLLLADEPTGSLDPATAADVFGRLRDLCKEEGCALLLVTHDLSLAAQLPRRFDASGLMTGAGGTP